MPTTVAITEIVAEGAVELLIRFNASLGGFEKTRTILLDRKGRENLPYVSQGMQGRVVKNFLVPGLDWRLSLVVPEQENFTYQLYRM